ncbi:AraC family transcriptional regulator [Klebsiella pneumoniae]|nr:AraC family transcriptional regulator [Klebsiella pneumoniae]
MGFNEYLNHIRLEQARMLLKGHDMKVKDIAHACGFADSNYFCRLFRKVSQPADGKNGFAKKLDFCVLNLTFVRSYFPILIRVAG